MIERDYDWYMVREDHVRLEEITSSWENRCVLERLRDNGEDQRYDEEDDECFLCILDEGLEDEFTNHFDYKFIIRRGDDLGWLGYFIGNSKDLTVLHMNCSFPLGFPLIEGICRNQTIQTLEIANDFGDYTSLISSLLRNNLASLLLKNMTVTNVHDLAMAFESCPNTLVSLTLLETNNFLERDVSVLAKALRSQPNIESLELHLYGWGGTDFCAALATSMLKWGENSQLRDLNLHDNNIDDEGMQKLVEGLACCHNLIQLDLSRNQMSAVGLRSLSSLYQTSSCCVISLTLQSMEIDDEGVAALVSGLADYNPLRILDLSRNAIGDEGVAALVSSLTTAENDPALDTLDLSENVFSIAGIRSLSTLLTSEKMKRLENLSIDEFKLCSVGASVLVEALANNALLRPRTGLRQLRVDCTTLSGGDDIFSRVLCDASSINKIYTSNLILSK